MSRGKAFLSVFRFIPATVALISRAPQILQVAAELPLLSTYGSDSSIHGGWLVL
jgi:hypothetical protein